MTELRGLLELGMLEEAQDNIRQYLSDPESLEMLTEMELAFCVVVASKKRPIRNRKWEDPRWVLSEYKKIEMETDNE